MPDPLPRLYARHLLQFGCGYPLWTPELGTQHARYRRDGLRIGDVGVIVPENGSFDVFFNICLPREHPFHRVNGVPDNFVPIDLDELDVATYPHAENDGSVISTSSVTTLRTIEPPDGAGRQRALTYEFSLSSSEGALLILPEGAESYALLKRKLFKDVATRHGADWYKFAEQQLGRIITHDSLYLITGCYKSHSWSVAAFHETLSHAGNSEFPAQFKPGQTRPGSIAAAYTWETTRALHWRVGPLGEWTAIPNQAVFISGFKIAIRDNILGRKKVAVEVDAPPTRLVAQKFSGGSIGHSRASRLWRSLASKGGGNKEAGDQAEAESANEPGTSTLHGGTDNDEHVTVTHVPETPQSVHPSDIVNRYLLNKEPSADVAVTHDSQWSILIDKGVLKPEDLTHEDHLERTLSVNYQSICQDGVASLRSVNDSSIQLTDVEDAVREAWHSDRLEDAEEILSRQIIRRTSSDHTLFAHRALIRARLQHWDAALRDAETSIDIQPSVSAHVARGFALFGQQKYALASHAFNVAVRECDVRDGVLVSLIKYIVLFEVGYHAESMAGISDLIEHCSAQIKSACSAAQTEAHLRLATIATKDENYERALQLLTRAESFGPFHAIQELEVISFICGWRFDNFQFSTHRQKCEVLYTAGRLAEAAESLQAMTRDLGEDVRMQEDNAKWINTFTQQSLKSLESLGDSSLGMQNYSEAVTQYSEALSMGPVTREGILVKRSNAYAAIGAWDDALSDASEAITLNPLSPWGHERKLAALKGLERHDEAIQAFNDMISALENFSGPQTKPIQRMKHRLQTHGTYPLPCRMDHKSIIESITSPTEDTDHRRTGDMLAMLRMERDEMVQGRNRSSQDGASNQAIGPSFTVGSQEQLNEQPTTSEQYQKLHDQLTDLVRQNRDDEKEAPPLMKAMLKLAEQQLILRPPQIDTGDIRDIRVFRLLEELHMYNVKQRELLDVLMGYRKTDSSGVMDVQQGKDSGTDPSQELEMPYSFRSVREDFIKSLAMEAQNIVEEIARLGDERRYLQQEIGNLMMMKSKYGPGGEFDSDWRPPPAQPHVPPPPPPVWAPRPPQAPQRPPPDEPQSQAIPPLPPADRPTGSDDVLVTRPGWRSVKPKQLKPRKPTRLKVDTTGLLGPSTPRKKSSREAELATERKSFTEAASKSGMAAEPPSPAETLPRRRDHDKSVLLDLPSVILAQSSLDRSSPKPDSSAPSPLSITFPPLDASRSEPAEEPASNAANTALVEE